VVPTHPLIRHHLTRLRDVSTPPAEFRRLVQRLAALLAYEATRDIPLTKCRVQTPLVETEGETVTARIGIVPILRAGLGMVDAVMNFLPDAEVWHLGLYRDEKTAQPVEYYSKLPPSDPVDVALVIDPMLATGGSAVAAIKVLQRWKVPRIKMVSLIASQPGVESLTSQFPDLDIVVAVVDPELNDHKYIVPGLGDAGDRIFNTMK
jgi:uracil phosphoribosyltransferase